MLIERFIGSRAWTDAALTLIDLEPPQWKARRIAYDGGQMRAGACSRASRLALSIDRSLSRGFAAFDLARVRRGATKCAVEAGQASPPCGGTRAHFRAVLLRHFCVKWRTNHCSRSL